MSGTINVLVVDDAVIVRRLVAQALSTIPGFTVMGTASDGDVALERMAASLPDVVVLDLDMPVLGGVSVLAEIRKRWPALPVVVFTGLPDGGPGVDEALRLGARDWLGKIPHAGNMMNAIGWVKEHLAPKLRAAVLSRPALPLAGAPSGPDAVVLRPRAKGARKLEVLAIGSSTGGPNALEEVLKHLPSDFPLPIVIVQHMPEGFTRLLAERLASATPFEAGEARHGMRLRRGRIEIAPGNRHMVVRRVGDALTLQLHDGPPENSCRPSVDVLFRSLAETAGAGTLAVILTGMGQDGLEGARLLVQAGGELLAQDEASSVVWGMPGAVARAELASAVVPLSAMADTILRRVGEPRTAAQPA